MRAEGEAIHPPTLGQALIQIIPVRIHRLEECNLSRAGAPLDLLLAGDGLVHAFISFTKDQPIAALAACEARREAFAVAGDPFR